MSSHAHVLLVHLHFEQSVHLSVHELVQRLRRLFAVVVDGRFHLLAHIHVVKSYEPFVLVHYLVLRQEQVLIKPCEPFRVSVHERTELFIHLAAFSRQVVLVEIGQRGTFLDH